MPGGQTGDERGLSDAVTVLLLIGIAIVLVGVIAVFVFDLAPIGDPGPQTSLSFEQTGDDNETIVVSHDGGDSLPEGTTIETTGTMELEDEDDALESLRGLSPGQQAEIELAAGEVGDRMSIVAGDTVVARFELIDDVS